jgi:hypothetical protein
MSCWVSVSEWPRLNVEIVLTWLPGEAMQTFGAAIDLQRLQAVSAFAFLGGILTSALRADGIRMDDGRG